MGIYMRLFCAYLKHQGPLPDDHKKLANMANVNLATFRRHADELEAVFEVTDGVWIDELAEERIREFNTASERNRKNIERRYRVVAGGQLEDPGND